MYPEWPEIDLAIEPKGELNLESPILRKGAFLFLKYGVLSIKNAFDVGFIRILHEFYLREYERYFEDKEYPDALSVGERRTMISLSLDGPFSDPAFYAAPGIFPLLQLLLGSDLILNSLGSVVSLPGAADQHIHRDHPNIYVASQEHQIDLSWIEKAPPYAVTLAVPLIALTEQTGGTRFWLGTHFDPVPVEELKPESGVDANVELGTAIIFDYRVAHGGVANRSREIRPLLYNVYSRAWFRDAVNYRKQDPLRVTTDQIRTLPKEHQLLFDWVFDADARKSLGERE